MQTKYWMTVDPILYKWIRFKVRSRKESVHTIPRTLHTSADGTCIQKLNKPTKFIEIMVNGWQHKAVCVESFLKYMVIKCPRTHTSQVIQQLDSHHCAKNTLQSVGRWSPNTARHVWSMCQRIIKWKNLCATKGKAYIYIYIYIY